MSEMITIKKSEYLDLVNRVQNVENYVREVIPEVIISDKEAKELNKLDRDKIVSKEEVENLLI